LRQKDVGISRRDSAKNSSALIRVPAAETMLPVAHTAVGKLSAPRFKVFHRHISGPAHAARRQRFPEIFSNQRVNPAQAMNALGRLAQPH
jgi:hypothetical protein